MISREDLKFDSLPQEVKDIFNKNFYSLPKVRYYKEALQIAQKNRQYTEILKINQEIDAMRKQAVDVLLNRQYVEMTKLTGDKIGLDADGKDKLNEIQITLYMICDMMDWAIRDMNSLLKTADPDFNFTMFDDMNALGKLVQKRIEFLETQLQIVEDGKMYDKSDNMYEMLLSKAKRVYKDYKTKKIKEILDKGKTKI